MTQRIRQNIFLSDKISSPRPDHAYMRAVDYICYIFIRSVGTRVESLLQRPRGPRKRAITCSIIHHTRVINY